jgi:hypothetical protein
VQEGLAVEAKMTGLAEESSCVECRRGFRSVASARRRKSRRSRCSSPPAHASYVTGAVVPMDGGANPVI